MHNKNMYLVLPEREENMLHADPSGSKRKKLASGNKSWLVSLGDFTTASGFLLHTCNAALRTYIFQSISFGIVLQIRMKISISSWIDCNLQALYHD